MADINGYKLKGELRTTNSGFSRWGFAEKNGKDVFIKELIDPVYPVHEELLSAEAVRRKKEICRVFEDRWRTIFEMVNECSDGNLVHIEDFFRYESHYYIIMEKIDAVPAEEVLTLRVEDRERICRVLVHALGGLHRRGLVHSDLKLDNILFRHLPSGKITAKVIDFDNCFPEDQPPEPTEEIFGDLVYMAPETFMMMQTESGRLTRAIDVFALGIIFHQVFTGQSPAFDSSRFDYPFESALEGQPLQISASIPDPWKQIIAGMLRPIPETRMSLEEAESILRNTVRPAPAAETGAFLAPAGDL